MTNKEKIAFNKAIEKAANFVNKFDGIIPNKKDMFMIIAHIKCLKKQINKRDE